MTEDDYDHAATDGGFKGNVVIDPDLTKLRLVANYKTRLLGWAKLNPTPLIHVPLSAVTTLDTGHHQR